MNNKASDIILKSGIKIGKIALTAAAATASAKIAHKASETKTRKKAMNAAINENNREK